jgi:uncharacterized integral membrane protein (TIGR00698 family)
LGFCVALAFVGRLAAGWIGGLSAAAAAVLLGLIAAGSLRSTARLDPGLRRASGTLLESAIVLLGLTVPVSRLPDPRLLLALLPVMGATLGAAALLGRSSGIGPRAGLLGGVGSAVCGSAAMTAAAPVLRVGAPVLAAGLASINLLSALGMFALPAAAHALGFDDASAGWWTGGSLQAVGQAVAAGFAFSPAAGEIATAVKLFRVATLVALIPLLGLFGREGRRAPLPWFVPGFIAAAVVAAILPPPAFVAGLVHGLIIVALVGIGASVHPRRLLHQGPAMLLVCAVAFLVQLGGVLLLLATGLTAGR